MSSVTPVTYNPQVSDAPLPGWRTALRERRWAAAETELAGLEAKGSLPPGAALAHAYALMKLQQPARALALLAGQETALPELATQILTLRAQAELHTAKAATGAEYLAAQGDPKAYVTATETLLAAKDTEGALGCANKAIELLTPIRDEASQFALVKARALRASVFQQRGTVSAAVGDWGWLCTQAITHPAAKGTDELWESSSGKKLTIDQRLTRALAFAKAGQLPETERELELLQAIPHPPLAAGYADWLLGKARSKARLDHVQGARMLERSITANVEEEAALRLEAARLYLRGGKEWEAARILEPLARTKGLRGTEARALQARAHAIVGDYSGALQIYDAILGKDKPKQREDLAFEQGVMAILSGQPERAIATFDAIAKKEPRESLRARSSELAAVAALESRRTTDAIQRFRKVIAQYPFTLGAWLSAQRLTELKESSPQPIPTPAAAEAAVTTFELPKTVNLLHELGLVDWASTALTREENNLRNRLGQNTASTMCNAYGAIGTAERRFAFSRDAVGNLDLTQLPDTTTRWRWDCRFPRPYLGMVKTIEKQRMLPMGLLYGVMRQESSYRERVVSPAGAVGLLQLLPRTATRLIRDGGPIPDCVSSDAPQLDEPRCNIELAARYLQTLLTTFAGQLPLAILSYNAGPHTVNRWLTAKKPVELDLFLALVPFAETRNYVHHVLTNYLVYAWLDGEKQLPALQMKPEATAASIEDLY